MKIRFHINYHTNWGEAVYLCGSIPSLGGGDPSKAVEMKLTGPDFWELEVALPATVKNFDYRFVVKAPGRELRPEWGEPHHFTSGRGISLYNVFNSWQDIPADKPFYSSAFTDGMLRRPGKEARLIPAPATALLRVAAPELRPDEVLAICGEGDVLGNWDPAKALICNDHDFPYWEAAIPLEKQHIPFQYKFIVLDRESCRRGAPEVKAWEECDNRIFGIRPLDAKEQITVDGLRLTVSLPLRKGAGTAIPVFSLRGEGDMGCGDFLDLKPLTDWAAATGQKVIQLLPVNDTSKTGTSGDSYPYSANSSFALHPLYLKPENAGELKDPARREHYHSLAAELNALQDIDYERTVKGKLDYMRELYAERGEATRRLDSYKEFMKANRTWLEPYAAWCLLRDEHGTPDCDRWGDFASYDAAKTADYLKKNAAGAGFHYFLQYHLDRQLREARDYARLNGVVLKGDIPIGVGRQSVDAWQNRPLFNMDSQAGAPPDDFSVLGQNWGFPTYNWEEMSRDGFKWWKDRFRKMADYFDAYRIDHILGFFRIWQIPLDAVHGLLGYFNPALPFSEKELSDTYDFRINPEVQTRPMIKEWMLGDIFGFAADEAKKLYLVSNGDGNYRLRHEVDTQRKVESHFAALPRTDVNVRLREGLLVLLDDVLFIEDPEKRGHYHPRISAHHSYQYKALTEEEQGKFNHLYHDFFYRRNNELWEEKAMWKLPPLIDATRMLCCAEDLGMIPACVPYVMERLRILSLEIQRMPKELYVEFGDTLKYPYYSVCATSSHDLSGIRGWWEEDSNRTQRYFNNVLHLEGEAPREAAPWICEKIINLHLDSPSMLCILPLQDWLSEDGDLRRADHRAERINVPADPHHYWRYRMHLSISQLLSADLLNARIREQIRRSGR